MKRPTRAELYDLAVVVLRGVNALMLWAIFVSMLALIATSN